MTTERVVSEAAEAFADVARTPSKRGVCHSCGALIESRDAVNVRATATMRDPEKSSGSVGLASTGRSFCPPCGRRIYGVIVQAIEGPR